MIFDLEGNRIGHLPVETDGTVRLLEGFDDMGELLFEQESFTEPVRICRYSPKHRRIDLWAKRTSPFDSREFGHRKIRFPAKDGVSIPIYLVGRRHAIEAGSHPTIMTSYGGYGIPMTPQFSVFVSYLMERGCVFALPNIRGGSEFGVAWHEAAKRRNRQVAFDDFISAAEWLIQSGHAEPDKLAIFGGSNSGLLVGVAMTQRPDLSARSSAWCPCSTCFVTTRLTTHSLGKVSSGQLNLRTILLLSFATRHITTFGMARHIPRP